ncbi:MAG: hypothetical protein V4726_02130 [Verrucomicrobiota bacterium]
MRIEHGKLTGDQNITEDLDLQGIIYGSAEVQPGIALHMGGTITENLLILPGGICKLDGMVFGNVHNRGGILRILGTIKGELTGEGGSTEIDPQAVIGGKRGPAGSGD